MDKNINQNDKKRYNDYKDETKRQESPIPKDIDDFIFGDAKTVPSTR